MLVELFNFFSDNYGPLRVFDYLSFRAIFATLTALSVSLILGPRFINKMHSIQVGQVIREEGPASHLSKKEPLQWEVHLYCLLYLSVLSYGET